MNLEFFRIFVTHTQQLSLLGEGDTKHSKFLEALDIHKPVSFKFDGYQYALVLQNRIGDTYAFAHLGKRSSSIIHKSPEEGFDDEEIPDWPTVPVFINLTDDVKQGQSIAIGLGQRVVKKPQRLLDALVDELSRRIRSSGYELNINPITYNKDFWQIIANNGKNVERVSFTFTTPNLFRAKDKLDTELTDAGQIYAATQVGISLENKDGSLNLREDQDFPRRAVQYVADGGGQYSIRLKGVSKEIRNGEKVKSIHVDTIEIDNAGNSTKELESACAKIFSCLNSLE